MRAPEPVLRIWRSLVGVPAENLSHRWWRAREAGEAKQRSVPLLEKHRAEWGTGGDSYDLTIWLMAKYQAAGFLADAVQPPADVDDRSPLAVMVKDPLGRRYLCDLNEPWLEPVLVSPRSYDFSPGFHSGFHPEGDVRVEVEEKRCRITLRRAGGGPVFGERIFELRAIPPELLVERAETDPERTRPDRLAVRRLARHPETGAWGVWFFAATGDAWRSGWRLPSGLIDEPPCRGLEAWVERVSERSGIAAEIVEEVLGRAHVVAQGIR